MLKTIAIIEVTVIALGALMIVTQILLPACRGRPLFPILRSRNRAAESGLADAREVQDVTGLQKKTTELRRQSRGRL